MLILHSYKVLNVGAKNCSSLSGLEKVCAASCQPVVWNLVQVLSVSIHIHTKIRAFATCSIFLQHAIKKTHLSLPILNVSFPFKAKFFSKQAAQAMGIHKSKEGGNFPANLRAFPRSGKAARICVLTRSWNYCLGKSPGIVGSKEIKLKTTDLPFL